MSEVGCRKLVVSSSRASAGSVGELRAELAAMGYLLVDSEFAAADFFEGLGKVGRPTQLRSVDRDEAQSWSLSGRFGRAAFPWHTDGAISSDPPRWLMLRPLELSVPTATELLDPSSTLCSRLERTVLLAKDHVGRARYLPALVPTHDFHRLRWDPRTCRSDSPGLVSDIEGTPPTAMIRWQLGMTLVVDNFRLLHRRPAVDAATRRVLERTYVRSQ
jgi:Taurine catabolism dioxygenase TauD, TfdA family